MPRTPRTARPVKAAKTDDNGKADNVVQLHDLELENSVESPDDLAVDLDPDPDANQQPDNVLKLEQQVLEGTAVHDAELADKHLMEAYRLISHKGMTVLRQPVKARAALEQAQAYTLKALQTLVTPNSPAHHKAIAQVANANYSIYRACAALEPEANGLYIEDAFVAASKALKLVSQARDSLSA